MASCLLRSESTRSRPCGAGGALDPEYRRTVALELADMVSQVKSTAGA